MIEKTGYSHTIFLVGYCIQFDEFWLSIFYIYNLTIKLQLTKRLLKILIIFHKFSIRKMINFYN